MWFAKREAGLNHDPDEYGVLIIIAAVIAPEHILAISTEGRNEAEVIIDPVGTLLDIDSIVYQYDLDLPNIPEKVETILATSHGGIQR